MLSPQCEWEDLASVPRASATRKMRGSEAHCQEMRAVQATRMSFPVKEALESPSI